MTRHRAGAYVWAQLLYWLAGVLLAGIIAQPTAFQGDAYLLPSVAAVVLGGTSLLGGRGYLVATAVAALFLSQLEQFVLALGVSFAVRTLVQAAALPSASRSTRSTGARLRDRLGRRSAVPGHAPHLIPHVPDSRHRPARSRRGIVPVNRPSSPAKAARAPRAPACLTLAACGGGSDDTAESTDSRRRRTAGGDAPVVVRPRGDRRWA